MENYYKIKVINVSQLKSGTAGVFTGKIKFKELLTIHRLTERKESTFDPFGEKKNVPRFFEDEEFQRHLSPKKLNEIKNYIIDEINSPSESTKAIYPSSVIISLDLNEDNSEELSEASINELFKKEMTTCFIVSKSEKDDYKEIFIPKVPRICLIVDGQHRFYGLKKFYDELPASEKSIIENFEFITTILLGFDPYQVAEVFANVNFHQKPVNRSLYYDIFGASSTDRNEIQFAHFLTLHLQNSSDSPLKHMIKLLGKGYGLFSQSFLVEKLLPHFNEKGVWNELYLDFKNKGEKFFSVADFIKIYFKSIEFNYNTAWAIPNENLDGNLEYSPFKYNYILCKTTGMGAFLRLIKDIYPRVKHLSSEKCKEELDKIFCRIEKDEARKLFSKNGEYGGGGSEGIQLKLYRDIKYRLDV